MKIKKPPKTWVYISLAIAIAALLVFTGLLSLGISPFWIMTVAYAVLAIGMLT